MQRALLFFLFKSSLGNESFEFSFFFMHRFIAPSLIFGLFLEYINRFRYFISFLLLLLLLLLLLTLIIIITMMMMMIIKYYHIFCEVRKCKHGFSYRLSSYLIYFSQCKSHPLNLSFLKLWQICMFT